MNRDKATSMEKTGTSESLRDVADRLPTRPGVYLFKDDAGRVIYVGKAQ